VNSFLREFLVSIYLLLVRVISALAKVFPLQDRVTVIETIGGHSPFLYKAAETMGSRMEWVFLKSGKPKEFRTVEGTVLQQRDRLRLLPYPSQSLFAFVMSLYYVSTSRVVIVDNYIGFLAAITFRPGVECIQLWHAVGGFKRTGLGDRSTQYRSKRAQARFVKVYSQFHKLAIGSEALAKIHMDAFGLPYDRMLNTGIPRTDLFFDESLMESIRDRLFRENPLLKEKTVVLYAPTYRDNDRNGQLHMDMDVLYSQLGADHVLLLRLHPAVKSTVDYGRMFPGFVFDYSTYPNINELLLVSDCLITDYSSVICEYALLTRPMIFYLYDLEEYLEQRGLWDGYEALVPGPVVKSTKELVECIRRLPLDKEQLQAFAHMWNTYSTGISSRNIVEYVEAAALRAQRLSSERGSNR